MSIGGLKGFDLKRVHVHSPAFSLWRSVSLPCGRLGWSSYMICECNTQAAAIHMRDVGTAVNHVCGMQTAVIYA